MEKSASPVRTKDQDFLCKQQGEAGNAIVAKIAE
jgi:hypothetical protein